MKKILYLGIVIASCTLVSCKKCKTCTTTTSQDYGTGTPQTTSTSQDYCGKDYDDAPAESNTSQAYGGYTQTVVVDCVEK